MSRNLLALTGCAIVCAVVPLGHAAATTSPRSPVRTMAATVRTFADCDALHRVYPHGVGRVHAHDHTSGMPVTTFVRDNRLYRANASSDRDKDGIACERR